MYKIAKKYRVIIFINYTIVLLGIFLSLYFTFEKFIFSSEYFNNTLQIVNFQVVFSHLLFSILLVFFIFLYLYYFATAIYSINKGKVNIFLGNKEIEGNCSIRFPIFFKKVICSKSNILGYEILQNPLMKVLNIYKVKIDCGSYIVKIHTSEIDTINLEKELQKIVVKEKSIDGEELYE